MAPKTGYTTQFFFTQILKIMKNWTLPLLALLSFGLPFCTTNDKKPASAQLEQAVAVVAQTLLIEYVKDGDVSSGPNLPGVKIAHTQAGTTTDTTYNGQSIQLTVDNGDLLTFTMQGKETVTIKVDRALMLKALGIAMFKKPTSGNKRIIKGKATDKGGMPFDSLTVKINTETKTDTGKYAFELQPAASFTIQFFKKNTIEIGAITLTTNGTEGTSIIDVTFDDNGTKTGGGN